MHRFVLVLTLVAVTVLSSPIRTAASPENHTESHTLYLPLTGAIAPCWIGEYGYFYAPDRSGEFSHFVFADIYPYIIQRKPDSRGPSAWAQFEIYTDAEGQSLLRAGELIDSRLAYSMQHLWSPPGGLEEGESYYLRVRARCEGVYTPWTRLAEFEATYRNEIQTFGPWKAWWNTWLSKATAFTR